jgi:magnesium chelatase family protein
MKKFSSCNSIFNGEQGSEILTVEADVSNGLFFFKIIGLADRMVQESRFRILSALRNAEYGIPSRRKVTISLLPAHVKKISTYSDLAIAAAYLIASKQVPDFKKPTMLIGQLGLDGSVSCADDLIHVMHIALQNDISRFVFPKELHRHMHADNMHAALAKNIEIAFVENLKDLRSLRFTSIKNSPKKSKSATTTATIEVAPESDHNPCPNRDYMIDSLEGIDYHKRALQIAVAGNHPILFGGIPGSGKSALAGSAMELMDDLTYEQSMELRSAYAHAEIPFFDSPDDGRPPLRNPHHNTTRIGLIGGVDHRHVGEISLANHGILILDELCEFERNTIESLREIFDHRGANIRKGSRQTFISFEGNILATTNLCPCGSATLLEMGHCRCLPTRIKQYQSRISNPILDRFHIKTVFFSHGLRDIPEESKNNLTGKEIRVSIRKSREVQLKRNGKDARGRLLPNGHLPTKDIMSFGMAEDATELMQMLERKFTLSKRIVTNTLRLARTISDLDHSPKIEKPHILEAFQYAKTNPFAG